MSGMYVSHRAEFGDEKRRLYYFIVDFQLQASVKVDHMILTVCSIPSVSLAYVCM